MRKGSKVRRFMVWGLRRLCDFRGRRMGWGWLGFIPQGFLETEQAPEAELLPGLGGIATA